MSADWVLKFRSSKGIIKMKRMMREKGIIRMMIFVYLGQAILFFSVVWVWIGVAVSNFRVNLNNRFVYGPSACTVISFEAISR